MTEEMEVFKVVNPDDMSYSMSVVNQEGYNWLLLEVRTNKGNLNIAFENADVFLIFIANVLRARGIREEGA